MDRFWKKVNKNGPLILKTRCWVWIAAKYYNGYGKFKGDLTSSSDCGAHRFAWVLKHGPISSKKFVCHKCDNRSCVRPSHLFIGSCRDNLQDMAKKGRSCRGHKQHMAALTEAQVRDLRSRKRKWGDQAKWAKEFGVARATICLVISGRTWRHL